MANCHLKLKNYSKAVNILKGLEQKDTVKFLMIDGLFKMRLYDECLKTIDLLENKKQNDFYLLDKKTRIYHNLSDYNKLLLVSNQGLKVFPDSSIFHLGKGNALGSLGDIKGAFNEFNYVIENSKDNSAKFLAYVNLYVYSESLEKEMYYLKEAYKLDSNSNYVNYYLGLLNIDHSSTDIGCNLLRKITSATENDDRIDFNEVFRLIKDNCN